MKKLVHMKSGPLSKLTKKRKLELCSLVKSSGSRLLKQIDSSRQNRKGESTRKTLIRRREVNKDQLSNSSKKQKRKGFRVEQSLCSLSKDMGDTGGLQAQNLNRRKRKRKRKKMVVDEASQLQRRARYLLVKLKLEQNLIDAYSGEGWKGQSREKIKPEMELQRAKKQILKCKLGLRDTIHQLDSLGSEGQIDDSVMSPDGSVHHEHIFCKRCKSQEVSEDNDIILCDGTCNCAFHQKCIDPPLATEDIPPEDEGWLCKYCDCKMEILEAMNAHLGTKFSFNSHWKDIFKEEALLSDIEPRNIKLEEEWPDDESDDDDYDPDGEETYSIGRRSMESGSDEESGTSSLCSSFESEEINGISSNVSLLHPTCLMDSDDHEIVSGPRQRSTVDYRKLYDEMFGKDTSIGDLFSEDEDWDPLKKKRRKKECDAASTLMTLCETTRSDFEQTLELEKNHLPSSKDRKHFSRIPGDALQKLRQAFAENELPSKAVKEKISEAIGLEYEKVNKWFKNARYIALKNRKQSGRATHCSQNTSESPEVNDTKGTSSPSSTRKMEQCLKKFRWNANLTTLIGCFKQQHLKKTSLSNTKANVELSDDICLKKHLLHLKAKRRRKKRVRHDNELLKVQETEVQIQQLCWVEAKLWKLKQILFPIQKALLNESEEPLFKEQKNVVYVPIAELKEKV